MVLSAVYDIIVPIRAAQGSFVSGINKRMATRGTLEYEYSRDDELYLVVGKSHASLTAEVEAKDVVIDSKSDVKDKARKRCQDGEHCTFVCYNTMTKKVPIICSLMFMEDF